MLYMVNKSPLMFKNLESALRIAPAGAPILLYEDGVYGAIKGTAAEAIVVDALEKRPVYALKPDLDARGLDALLDGVETIDYDGFVALVEAHHVAPWL